MRAWKTEMAAGETMDVDEEVGGQKTDRKDRKERRKEKKDRKEKKRFEPY